MAAEQGTGATAAEAMEQSSERTSWFKIYAIAQHPEDDTLVSDLFSANAEEKLVCCPNLQFTEISTFHTSYCAVEDRRKVIEPRLDVHEFMPLITAVVAGKSASIIVGGTASDLVRDSMNALRYVSVDDQPIGLIEMLATKLIETSNTRLSNNSSGSRNDGGKEATLTLSWHAMDCAAEGIVDVLKCASELSSMDPTEPPARSRRTVEADPALVLRDLGKGRGICVPGLWEVAIQSGQDAAAIVGQVWETVEKPLRSHVHTFNLTYMCGKAIGRLFVTCLSNLDNSSTQQLGPGQTNLWARVLQQSIDAVIHKRPSPPFHRSRCISLLRDALTGHMRSRLMLFLSTGIDTLPQTWRWLQLAAAVEDCVQVCSKATAVKERLQASLVVPQTPAVPVPAAPEPSSSRHHLAVTEETHLNGKQHIPQQQQQHHHQQQQQQQQQQHVSFDEGQLPQPPPSSTTAVPAAHLAERSSMRLAQDHAVTAAPLRLSLTTTALTKSRLEDGAVRASSKPQSVPKPKPKATAATAEMVQRPSSNENARPSKQQGSRNPPARQSTAALNGALQSSQAEVLQLLAKVQQLQEQNEELQQENRSLLELQAGLQEASFARRLQGKLRKALKELKEYEVYRSVMEGSVAKNERQITQLTQENAVLKKKLDQALKAAKATRHDHNATLQELMTVRRDLTAAETRLQGLNELNDNVDTARANLKAERDALAKEVQQLRAKLTEQTAAASTTIEMLKKDLQAAKHRLQRS